MGKDRVTGTIKETSCGVNGLFGGRVGLVRISLGDEAGQVNLEPIIYGLLMPGHRA